MRNRHLAVIGAVLASLMSMAPTSAQDGTSPSPSVAPIPSAIPSSRPSIPVRHGPRWSIVSDRDVRRSGVLGHVVSLGIEGIALAQSTDARGQTRVRVLATGDGATWRRRGVIRLTGSISDLVADGTALVAVGWDQGAMIWRSDDGGATWSRPADPSPFAGGADGLPGSDEGAQVDAIALGPSGLVAVGDATDPDTGQRRAAAWRSADGLVWQRVVEVATLPPFQAIAADAATYVVVGSTTGAPTSPGGSDEPVLRWSVDGVAWTPATAVIASTDQVDGVSVIPGDGFLTWGRSGSPDDPTAIMWSSADGRTWERLADNPALAGAQLASVRSLEGGALTMAVGGVPRGAYAWPRLGAAWRRDRIRARTNQCVADVVSVRAILVAVGGTCGVARPRGRAWTSPLGP